MSDEEFQQRLLGGASVVRWGDGETALARGKNISYQESNAKLSNLLKQGLQISDSSLIFGLPWAYSKSLIDRKWNVRYFKIFLSTRVLLAKSISHTVGGLIDTEVWYRLYPQIPNILQIISSERTLVLITGNAEFLKACPPHTIFISTPKKNSFNEYEKIVREINDLDDRYNNLTLLLAAGPLSKTLAFRFIAQHQVLDIGHGFDFYLRGFGKYAWTRP